MTVIIPDVPTDVLTNIFIRLPIEDLARFKCVSKTWLTLISDHIFLKLHTIRHRRYKNDDDKLYIISRRTKEFYSISLSSFEFDDNEEYKLRNSIKASMPTLSDGLMSYLDTYLLKLRLPLPTCHGLILNPGVGMEDRMHWAVFNPFIGDFHPIPRLYRGEPEPPAISGFGYDYISDDYKVVKVTLTHRDYSNPVLETFIYSLKSKEWRRIKDYPDLNYVGRSDHGVFFNGAIHWVAERRLVDRILALDLSTENYHQLPVPSGIKHVDANDVHLDALGGQLFISCSEKLAAGTLDVWKMEDYGRNNMWTKFMSYRHRVNNSIGHPKLMAYFKDKMKVLIMYTSSGGEYKKAFLFDLVTKCEKEVPLDGLHGHIICKPVPANLTLLNAVPDGSLSRAPMKRKREEQGRSQGS